MVAAVVWEVLASLNPTTTYHLAPLLVAAAATVVSVLVAFVVSWLLAARHALAGPALVGVHGDGRVGACDRAPELWQRCFSRWFSC